MQAHFVVADEIEVLKRGEEIIIFNAVQVNPIYFPVGGNQALDLLAELKKMGPISAACLPDFCSQEAFDFFCAHFLIIPEDSSKTIEQKKCCGYEMAERLSFSRSVYLLLTHSCNQACIYCFNGKNTYQKHESLMMSEEVAFKSLDNILDSIAEFGKLEIVFFGGEPLMNWNLAKKVIDYCNNNLIPRNPGKQIAYHLTTNLTLFPDDLIEVALQNNITFLVDIDGPEEIHNKTRPFINGQGSFRTTAGNVEKLIKAGLKVSLRATVTSYTDSLMMDVAKTHQELGAAGCAFVPLNPVDSDIKLLDLELCPSPQKYAEGLREVFHSGIWPITSLYPFNEYNHRLQPSFKNPWGCGAPIGNTPVITSNGEIYSCIYLVGNKQYEVGNILMDDFPRKNVLARMLDIVNVDNRKKCRECSYRYLCGGGCPIGIFSIEGNPKAPNELKEYVREISCTVSKTVLQELFWNLAAGG